MGGGGGNACVLSPTILERGSRCWAVKKREAAAWWNLDRDWNRGE